MKTLLACVALAALVACGKKPEPTPPPPATASVPNKEFLAALFRGTDTAEKICIAGPDASFLFYYPKGRIEDVEGWFIVEKVQFQLLPNGTLVFPKIEDYRFKQVHPNVEGLECGAEQDFRK